MFSSRKRVRDDDDDNEEEEDIEASVPEWVANLSATDLSRDALGLTDTGLLATQAGLDQEQTDQLEDNNYFEPRALPSRRKEYKRLHKPGARSDCFLCVYVGERDTLLPSDDVDKIVEMLRQNTGRMDSSALAEMIADYYAGFRAKINSSLQRGERALPPMSAATVLQHIRCHHQDPEVKQIVMLEELQEIREHLMSIMFERNKKTRHTRVNKVHLDALEKIIKTELMVQSKDPSKMALYSAGARINPTIHKQGPVAAATKNLYSYWRTGANAGGGV
jgi:hypothetical protein